MDGYNDEETDYKHLRFLNSKNEEEIAKLRLEIKNFVDNTNSLEKEILDHKQTISRLIFFEENYRIVTENLEKAQREILVLKEEVFTLTKTFQNERETPKPR